MGHRPILVDVTHIEIDDHGLSDRVVMLSDFDASAILASAIGRDVEAIASFLADPYDHSEILQAAAQHPDVDDVTAELDGDHDWAGSIREGLTPGADEEEIAEAWLRWMDAWDAHNGASWVDMRWAKHDVELARWLEDAERPSPETMKGMARRILADRAFRNAILEAARDPADGNIESMRTCVAVETAFAPSDAV